MTDKARGSELLKRIRRAFGMLSIYVMLLFTGVLVMTLSGNADAEEFGAFFAQFKQAVEVNDYQAIGGFAADLVEIEDQADNAGAPLDHAAFMAKLPDFLEQDAGQSSEFESVRSFLLRSDAGDFGEIDGSARAGPFLFLQTPEGWRIIKAFTEE